MNLGKTWLSLCLKKVIKLKKKDNVGVNNKYTSLLKKVLLTFFSF